MLRAAPQPDRLHALTAGYRDALLACAIFLLAAAAIALRAANSRGDVHMSVAEPQPARLT